MEKFNNKKINELIKELNNDIEEAEITKADAKSFIDYITNDIYKAFDIDIYFCVSAKREIINNLKSVLIDNETHKLAGLVYHINNFAESINNIGHNGNNLYDLIPKELYKDLNIYKGKISNNIINDLYLYIQECGIYHITKEEIINYFNDKDNTNKFLKQLKEFFNYE